MSLLKTSLENPAATIPFKVRLEPYLVESICELARTVRDKGASASDISGLLFGKAEAGSRSVEALKTFVDMGPHSELARRQRWEKAYQATAEESKTDLELSHLEIVGWFSFRTGSGLLSSDVVFHNQHFRKPEDVALIIWREGPSQLTTEVYSRSETDPLTSDDYRWGSVRLSADIRHMRESVELIMRVRMNEDSYLRTYQSDEPQSHFEALKRRAELVSERLFGFLHRGKEDAHFEKVKGLIGDGRVNGRSMLSLDAIEPLPNPQAYFNPYSESGMARSRLNLDSPVPTAAAASATPELPPAAATRLIEKPVQSPAPSNSNAWPTSGSGLGTAPARIPDLRPDFRFNEAEIPVNMPPSRELDMFQIGRSPRTGRAAYEEISGLPMSLRPTAPPKGFPWALTIGMFLFCSTLVFGFLALGGLQGENGHLGQIVQAIFPGGGLNLRIHNEDERLRLSWNQRNRAVATARGATLQILDGPLNREIHLDGRQVADGSVLYKPVSNDITFRLDIKSEQGSISGDVRVLDGLSGRQPTLDVSAPLATGNSLSALPEAGMALPTDPSAPALLRNGTAQPLASGTIPVTAAGETAAISNVLPAGVLLPSASSASAKAPLSASIPATSSSMARSGQTLSDRGSVDAAASVAGSLPPAGVTKSTSPSATTTSRHYETPETIGTIQPSARSLKPTGESPLVDQLPGGSSTGSAGAPTIHGWDSVPTLRSKSRSTTAPRSLAQVTPNIRSLPVGSIPAKTRVAIQVNIDPSGHVIGARVLTAGINPKVASAAVTAARQWTFDPAKSNGRHISSQRQIVFEFPAH